MSAIEFDDILQQAEHLTADLDGGNELPRVQRNFQQLRDASQRLRSGTVTTQDNAQVKASLLLSTQGYEVPRLSDRLKTLASASQSLETLEPVCDTDIESHLRNQRENAILAVLEEQKTKSFEEVEKTYWQSRLKEWEKQKQSILGKLIGTEGSLHLSQDFSEYTAGEHLSSSARTGTGSTMDAWEVGYACQVQLYNEKILAGAIRPDFVNLCRNVAQKMQDDNIVSMWNMVKYILDAPISIAEKSVVTCRSSKKVIQSIVSRARAYLEDSYRDYMLKCVQQRPHAAQLGGKPGTINLIRSYIKVKPAHQSQGYDVTDWALLYFCLRCGDLKAALEVAKTVDRNIPDLSTWIAEYSRDRVLSPSSEHKLQLQYKRTVRNAGDPYATAVFCILGKCDVSETHADIAEKTDDYLWIKLSQIVVTPSSSAQSDTLTLLKLQMLLSEYGESHFDASKNPLLFFQVLFLSYQFEAAIEFLSRFPSLRCHALHVALAMHEANLLVKATNLHDSLLSSKPTDQCPLTNVQRLNFPRLLMLYTRKFELTDPREALNYLYFLREEKHEGQSMFMQCVSELVRETGEFSMLLGGLNADGSRRPGLVDSFCGGDTIELIAKVAKDIEAKGLFEDAVLLYDFCGSYDNVLFLLNRMLGPVVSAADGTHSDRLRIKTVALNLAQRYRTSAAEMSRDLQSTFYTLLDLITFFDLYHTGRYNAALSVINELHMLPSRAEQVQAKVSSFSSYSEEVRRNIGEILLATMNVLAMKVKRLSHTSKSDANQAHTHARALLTFAGMLPYQLPGDITSKLVQLEVDMM